ncbi:ParA family protein [Azospirillum griseum]|uniref:ParA family protein n=1 Tax=Azospirillum griseum TaxID=2496639 RepID=A0A431VDM2_9PROT|nr:ParA family protein [Azospirillum griseum]RTR17385.1 ParA family protein [Azospirillum griseum]
MSGKIIAVGNLKGGTGKSTVAVNLACALRGSGKVKVAVVDADAQGTASDWAAKGRLGLTVHALPFEESENTGHGGGSASGRDGEAWGTVVERLRLEHDFVVIDLPPQLGDAILNALVAANLFVVPVTASGADLKATTKAIELLRRARARRDDGRPACLLVPSRVDRRTAAGKEIEAVLHDFGEPVAPAIGQRTAHVDAFTAGEWVGSYAPRSAAHGEIDVLAAIVKRVK